MSKGLTDSLGRTWRTDEEAWRVYEKALYRQTKRFLRDWYRLSQRLSDTYGFGDDGVSQRRLAERQTLYGFQLMKALDRRKPESAEAMRGYLDWLADEAGEMTFMVGEVPGPFRSMADTESDLMQQLATGFHNVHEHRLAEKTRKHGKKAGK